MSITSIATFSQFLDHDPEANAFGDDCPLPIFELKAEAFEYFRFDEWNIQDNENPHIQSYPSVMSQIGDPKPTYSDDSKAYQLYMQRKLKELEGWHRSVAGDLDATITFALKIVEPLQLEEDQRQAESRDQFALFLKEFPLLPFKAPALKQTYHGEAIFISVFQLFLNWLEKYFEDENIEVISLTLPSGRVASTITVVSAMAILAFDKAIGAALKNETWATSVFLIGATSLISKSKDMFEYEYEMQVEEKKNKNRLEKRHEKTYAIKAFALSKARQFDSTNYSKLKITKLIFPEVEAHAKTLKQPFSERGFKTVYDWILKNSSPPA